MEQVSVDLILLDISFDDLYPETLRSVSKNDTFENVPVIVPLTIRNLTKCLLAYAWKSHLLKN
jgi:hypothetical protein